MQAQIDHLVIAAQTLDEGVRWCEATLGVTPPGGGSHPLMGTHNRVLSIASEAFPKSYLEIIAIERGKRPARGRHMHRWFDLDDPVLQAGLAQHGPQLVHFVARVPDARAAVHALAAEPTHIDRGHVLEAARDTPAGRLEWQITVRDDGQRLFYGALPTLIQWGPVHPVDSLPASGVALNALAATHPRDQALGAAFGTLGLNRQVEIGPGAPNLIAVLQTPRGPVTLQSKGL